MSDILVTKPQVTSLLSNETLARLTRMRVIPRRRLTSRSRGEHLARRTGTSTEFCDYRDYAPGDDVRFVDWNIFARLNRPFLKLYHQEEEMHLILLIDASASMGFEGKLDLAKRLAAAFGVMGLHGAERVSAYAFNTAAGPVASLPPSRGRASLPLLFEVIEPIASGGDAPVENDILATLRTHHGRGIALIISDFLTFGDVEKAFNRLFSAGLEISGIQILGPSEIDPELGGDTRLVDAETGETLDVTAANDLLGIYQDHRIGFEQHLATLCRQRAGRFVSIRSDTPVEWTLFDLLRRKGWIR